MACPKGWEALTPLAAPDRATHAAAAQRRRRARAGRLGRRARRRSCDALQGDPGASTAPSRSRSSAPARSPTEEMALLGALAKFGMGMVHGDGNTRQCMATAVVAYKQAFGFDAPPYTYARLRGVRRASSSSARTCASRTRSCGSASAATRTQPEIVVIDPRKTETAMAATQHLRAAAEVRPVLLLRLAHLLIARGWIDRAFIAAHTSGFDDFAAHVAPFTLERVGARRPACRAPTTRAARRRPSTSGKRVSFWWTMGVNQSHEGVRTAQAIINLALMTGNIGRPGHRRQLDHRPVQRDGLAPVQQHHQPARRPRLHQRRSTARRSPASSASTQARIPTRAEPGLRPDHRGDPSAARSGRSGRRHQPGALLDQPGATLRDVLGAARLPGRAGHVRDDRDRAQRADLVLPAAGWGEKEGTFINSERRIGLVKKVSRAPGQALADFHIFQLIAEAWGCGDMFARLDDARGRVPDPQGAVARAALRHHRHRRLRACSTTGAASSGRCPRASRRRRGSERRLFEDGRFFTPTASARFIFEAPRAAARAADDALSVHAAHRPRQLEPVAHADAHRQVGACCASSPRAALRRDQPRPTRARSGSTPNEWVVVESRRGAHARPRLRHPRVQPGQVFMPMHYADTNQLTFALRPPLAPARVQALRRPRPPRKRRAGVANSARVNRKARLLRPFALAPRSGERVRVRGPLSRRRSPHPPAFRPPTSPAFAGRGRSCPMSPSADFFSPCLRSSASSSACCSRRCQGTSA